MIAPYYDHNGETPAVRELTVQPERLTCNSDDDAILEALCLCQAGIVAFHKALCRPNVPQTVVIA